MKLVLFINSAELFLTHRQHLARQAQREGYQVTILCPPSPAVEKIRAGGFACATLPLQRQSLNPLNELRTLGHLYQFLRSEQPDVVHCFTLKPMLYGTAVARALGLPRVVNSVTGLGFSFTASTWRARVARAILHSIGRRIFRHPRIQFIFQNPEDRDFCIQQNWTTTEACRVIPGTGINPHQFQPGKPRESEICRILFAGRFLSSKGLPDLIQACDGLFARNLKFTLVLCGRLDPGNPCTLTRQHLREIIDRPYVEYLGYCEEMEKVYPTCDVACLPSTREGLPLSLIEAASCELPVVTTDVPGCRQVVISKVNGLLVKVHDVAALQTSLAQLIVNPPLRKHLGIQGRERVLREFDFQKTVPQCLETYRDAP